MGFVSASSAPLFSIRYSAFLGALYLHDQASIDAIKAVKAALGEDVVKRGFQGSSENSPSANALSALRRAGVKFGRMKGALTGVRLIEREVGGRKSPYLSVTVTDDAGKYNLSVSVSQRGVQMLIRKLANAQPGAESEIGLFATYGQREGADRAYAEHGATLAQSGSEVKGIDPREALAPAVNAAIEALKGAGVDDKDTIAKRRSSVETNFHVELVKTIQQKFERFYAEREQSMDHMDQEATSPSTVAYSEDETF